MVRAERAAHDFRGFTLSRKRIRLVLRTKRGTPVDHNHFRSCRVAIVGGPRVLTTVASTTGRIANDASGSPLCKTPTFFIISTGRPTGPKDVTDTTAVIRGVRLRTATRLLNDYFLVKVVTGNALSTRKVHRGVRVPSNFAPITKVITNCPRNCLRSQPHALRGVTIGVIR